MLPYKLRAPLFGNVEQNKLRKTDGADEGVLTGGGPMPTAIALDLKTFQTGVVTHLHGLEYSEDKDWASGEAFKVFKQLFGGGKIGLLHWLLPHIKCDQQSYSQIIYAACFECLHDCTDLLERCVAVMTLYTLYETNPLLRTGSLKPEDYIPVGLQWREFPRALYRRAFRQRIRIDRTSFIKLLKLREECHICIHKQGAKDLLAGVVKDTIVVLERLSSHWDFCEYTGPVGLEAMAGHPDYPYRENEDKVTKPSQPLDEEVEVESLVGAPRPDEASLKSIMSEYQSAVHSIYLGSTKTKLVSDLRTVLYPVLPREGKPSWPVRIDPAAIENQLSKRSSARNDDQSTRNLEDNIDTSESQPLSSTEYSPQHRLTHRLVVPEEISDKSQRHLDLALQELLQRYGTSFMKKETAFQVEARYDLENDLSTIGGVGAASIAPGQGRAALDTLLASAQAPGRIPTRVVATFARDNHEEVAGSSWNRFLYSDLRFDTENEDEDSSVVSNVSFDSDLYGERDDDDEASVATSAIGKRALDLLLSKVSKSKTSSSSPRQPAPSRRKPVALSHDDQSRSSSIGIGQAALGSLLKQVESRKKESTRNYSSDHGDYGDPEEEGRRFTRKESTVRAALDDEGSSDSGNPLTRKPTRRSKRHEIPPQARRQTEQQEPKEQSSVSSVGAGNMALDELLQLAAKKPTGAETLSFLPQQRNPSLRKASRPTLDDQSKSSSVGIGQAALSSLLDEAKSRTSQRTRSRNTPQDESDKFTRIQTRSRGGLNDIDASDRGTPPTRKRTRSSIARETTSPQLPRERWKLEREEQSMASSVGAGNVALEELLRLAEKKPAAGRKQSK